MGNFTSRPIGADRESARFFVTDEDRRYARDNIGSIARRVLGKPAHETKTELRFFDDLKLVVNIAGHREGSWKLFGQDVPYMRDAYGLVQYALNCDFSTAVAFIFGDRSVVTPIMVSKTKTPIVDWSQIIPPPANAPKFDPQAVLWENHELAGVWTYNAPDGSVLFHLVRQEETKIDPETGEIKVIKKTPVVTYGRFGNGRLHWRAKGAGLNILFGLDELAKRPAAPVLVVEGEKSATAARLLFPDWVVICWKGGCGNVGKIDFTPLRGRIVYFLADADDAGVEAMGKAEKKAAAAGAVRTTLAKPPQACWEMKKGWDLADDLPAGWTIDGIRDYILMSDTWTACGLPAYYNAPLMPARDARRLQAKVIREFISDEAQMAVAREMARQRSEDEAAQNANLTPAQKGKITRRHKRDVARMFGLESLRNGHRMLVTGSQGTGKSSDSLKAIAKLNIPWLRIVFTLPTVEKAWEAMVQYNGYRRANSLPAYVVRGRGAYEQQPDEAGIRLNDDRMCPRYKTVNRAAAMRLAPRQTICPTCPFRHTCGSLKQEADLAEFTGGVFFMAREYVFLDLPVDNVHMLIGDESLTAVAASEPVYVDPQKIKDVGAWKSVGLEAAVDTMAALGPVYKAVTEHSGAILAGLREMNVAPKALRQAGAYLDDVREEAVKSSVDGSMTDEQIERILDDIQKLEFGSVSRLCRQLAIELAQPRAQANTVCLRHPKDKETGEAVDRVAVFHLKSLRVSKETPVLLLDGTGSVWLNRKVFGDELIHHHVPIERSAVVLSTLGRQFSRQSVTGTDRNDELVSDAVTAAAALLRRDIVSLATSLKQSVFVCSTMRAEASLEPEIQAARQAGADIATAHFADVRGKNRWQSYPVALLIGREEVTPWALEDMTRPFLADDSEPLIPSVNDEGRSCYVNQCRGRRMRDGTVVPVEVSVHPDPRCETMHEQIREAELLQALDRVRAIYNHRTVYLLNNLVLDVTYDANLSWRNLKAGGTRFDIAFQRTDQTVFLDAPGEWSRCFPDLWPNKNVAKCALKAEGGVKLPIVSNKVPSNKLLANQPPLRISYQRPGQGQQPCTAWVFAPAAAARATLEKVVGPILDSWSIDWTATISARALPTVPAPLDGSEVDDDEVHEAAAYEPDEPAIAAATAAGKPITLDTNEGFREAITWMRALSSAGVLERALARTWTGDPDPAELLDILTAVEASRMLADPCRTW